MVREYVIHKITKRIHVVECESYKKMNDKNKIFASDTLANLIKNGYIVCGNCNAGIKKKNLISELFDNINPDLKYYEVGILPTKAEFVNSINMIGNWYINNVPTYCKNIEFSINENGENVPIANECAMSNYKNFYHKITKKSGIYCYPCQYISKSKDDYKKAGDDCVRFFFTCMNNINSNFTYDMNKISNVKWTNINAKKMCSNDKIADAMFILGFDVYDSKPKYRDYDNDGEYDYLISQITSNFELKYGDVLVSNNHVHIYLDDGKLINAKNFGWGHVSNHYPSFLNFKNNFEVGIGSYYIIENENDTSNVYTRIYRYKN